jgi:hypothetical protein
MKYHYCIVSTYSAETIEQPGHSAGYESKKALALPQFFFPFHPDLGKSLSDASYGLRLR